MKITQEMIDYCRGLGEGTLDPMKHCSIKRKKDDSYETKVIVGLCQPFKEKFMYDNAIPDLSDLIDFRKFLHFSGSIYFPVSVETFKISGDLYSYWYLERKNFWDPDTEYGRNRMEFSRWCADELERKMREQ